MDYKSISVESFSEYIDLMSIVLITVTDIEKKCLHEKLTPLLGLDEILVVQEKFYTYYIGMLGKYAVCHVASRMGTSGAAASIMTVQQAVEFIKPSFIIMVGIAFGVNKKEQRVGDVLVSELIVQYENMKIKKGKIECRGYKQMSSVLLLNRFTNPIGWKFNLTPKRDSKVLSGNILSGEKLIDDIKYREQLVKLFDPVIGGEMEGTGLASVAHAYSKDWLVVKGICDFADGKKAINKIKKQYTAARAAVDLCASVFDDNYTFKDLAVFPYNNQYDNNDNAYIVDQIVFRNATFNAYSISKEEYYLNRDVDNLYANYINFKYNIWVFGGSGFGKTCMTFRNLVQAGKKIFVIDFSSIDTDNMLSVFEYMQRRLMDSASYKGDPIFSPTSIMQAMDNICDIINKYYDNAYIIMEEMPLNNKQEDLFKNMLSLIVKNSIQYPDSTVNFAFTSINNPKDDTSLMIDKIGEKINFIEAQQWTKAEMEGLLDIMAVAVDCRLSVEYKNILIGKSDFNPRRLKTYFRDLILYSQSKEQSFEFLVKQYFEIKFGHA
ncbi:5'-methylthioadenosine/S-adenosylhomocysteine nucleosidase [Hymenobacter sp. BT18]|uniref:5'-methylthioadenosine/S-adenosylhomocysteine nucleosidase family protein n=1 Tax=Hymenobacter sp. BT18 TaxID=2835648 RepID=UPI00143EB7BB|nr:5'-methylthioadenosine/S-adenosylhomocysteine nucleosidase [Hymenobacter sp. BT18]QIX62876.1 5'-methylthioadenosine/S-adenosylhomocysteine nucleosidase [Hymenobacter sp. BT18]